jgi:hypothetical protein
MDRVAPTVGIYSVDGTGNAMASQRLLGAAQLGRPTLESLSRLLSSELLDEGRVYD